MFRTILLGVLFSFGFLAFTQQARASASSVEVPVDFKRFVPCANGGHGEWVHLTGTVHREVHVHVDGDGGVHIAVHSNPQGVSGVGESTGDKYQGTGVTKNTINAGPGFNQTFVNRFNIIGQGPDNNFQVHETFHVTVDANGEVEVIFDNFEVKCS